MASDNKSLVNLLVSLDISRTEALTYKALLEMEDVSIRKIAAQTGINRGSTYEALKNLTNKGLASVRRKGNSDRYLAEPPSKILNLIRDKRRDLVDAASAAKELIPELAARKIRNNGQAIVRYYEDDDGVVTILKDVLQTCRDLPIRLYYVYSSAPIRRYLYRKFPQFTKRRIAESIHVKVIAMGEGGDPAENSERRWLLNPVDTHTSSYVIVYGTKVATISIASDDTPYGVIIEDEGAASMQRLLFEQLWNFIGQLAA